MGQKKVYRLNKSIEEVMTTPPLPSSSPAPNMDVMEMSPLPHKLPYTLTTEVVIQSPTPEMSVDSSMCDDEPSPLAESPMEDAQPMELQE
jgi:M-phase inducer tyrosine phosphatase